MSDVIFDILVEKNKALVRNDDPNRVSEDEPQLNTIAYRKALKEYGSKYNVSNGRVYKKINIDST